MDILLCVVIGGIILLSPILVGLVGHRFCPIAIGMRKFRSYLDLHSRITSKRVPDEIVRKIVEKGFSASQIDGQSDAGAFVAWLATMALLLIDFLENTEKAIAIDPDGTLIDHEWLKDCGVTLPIKKATPDDSEEDEYHVDPEVADVILRLDPRIQLFEKSLGGRKLTVEEMAELLTELDSEAPTSSNGATPSLAVEEVPNIPCTPAAFPIMTPKEAHDFHLKVIDPLRQADKERRQ